MQVQGKAEVFARAFRRRLEGVSYDGISAARGELKKFLEAEGVGREEAGKLLLAMAEILNNLVRHPPRKAAFAEILVEKRGAGLRLDIADDSAPFMDFMEKCEAARGREACGCMEESGYGLACILRQHAAVAYTPMTRSADGLNHFTVGGAARRRRVFLIDDDPVALKVQGRMLEEAYDVVAFSRAEEALEAFGALRPELVISDLVMPEMDGTELRRALARLPGGKETPFVFLSGLSERRHMPYINALGIDDFLCKPASREQLLSVAERLLRRSAQIRDAVGEKVSAGITGLLKPALPAGWRGWRMAVLSAAAETGGGDFVSHHAGKESFLAVLADVMGHGTAAKFFSYAYAGYLRSLLNMQEDRDPAGFLEKLSACTRGDEFLENTVMTCQCVQLFPDGRARIVSAGHPAPVLAGAGGARDIEVAGPLPGMVGDSRYEARELNLLKGEKIVLATDGFFGAFDGGNYRHEQLLPVLDGLGALRAEDVAARAWEAFAALGGSRDDATLVVMEYEGE